MLPPSNLLHKLLLQLANLHLELLNLLPAVQRSAVMSAETLHYTFLRLLYFRTRLLHLLPCVQLLSQVHNLFLHAITASAGVCRSVYYRLSWF